MTQIDKLMKQLRLSGDALRKSIWRKGGVMSNLKEAFMNPTMTQIDELAKRLRALSNDLAETECSIGEKFILPNEAADALEAQAARVKEVEAELDQAIGVIEDRRAQVATLEAQLEEFREAAKLVRVQSTNPTDAGARLVGVQAWDALMSTLRNAEGEKDGE